MCAALGDTSTKLLRSFAYGTAQDDSVFLRAHTWVRPYVLKATFLCNRGEMLYDPSVAFGDSSPYAGEPYLLQRICLTLANGRR